jgi:hypothetical protein
MENLLQQDNQMVIDSLRNLLVMLSKLAYVTASDRLICVLNSK